MQSAKQQQLQVTTVQQQNSVSSQGSSALSTPQASLGAELVQKNSTSTTAAAAGATVTTTGTTTTAAATTTTTATKSASDVKVDQKDNSKKAKVRQVGNYIVGQTLGEGAFSKVKLGYDVKTQQKVALKVIKRKKLNVTSQLKSQIEKEVSVMQMIQHKHVIRLVEVMFDAKYPKKNGKLEEVMIIVLELATGGEFFEFLLTTGSFEESLARTYFRQLIDAIDNCHSKGISHRDLKPENLLLSANFDLKLADFGMACLTDSKQNLMYTECGTLGYMPPEIFSKKGYDPMLADIWACGIILFITIAGFPPFQQANTQDWWFNQIANGKRNRFWEAHQRNASFSDGVKDLLNKILTPDPSQRITLAKMKQHEWFNGKVLSAKELLPELQRRKNEVDQEKNRAAMEKKHAAMSVDKDIASAIEGVTWRSVAAHDPNSGDLPPLMNPDILFSAKGLNLGQKQNKNFDSLMQDQGSLFSIVKKQVKLPEPPKYTADNTVDVYTNFKSDAAADLIVSRLSDALQALKAKYSLKDTEYKYKVQLNTGTGIMLFSVHVFSNPDKSSEKIIEFRRRKGDVLQFQKIFMIITANIGDIVTKAKQQEKADVKQQQAAVESKQQEKMDTVKA